MTSGFQTIESRSTPGEGAFGTGSFGDSPFGGEKSTPWALPQNMIDGDEAEWLMHRRVAEIVHDRDGIEFQARRVAERKVMNFHFMGEPRSFFYPDGGTSLHTFFDARIFYFLPNFYSPGTVITVKWVGTDYRPVPNRSDETLGSYDFKFSVIEVPHVY